MQLINPIKLCEYANNLKDKQIDANDIMRFPTIEAEPVRHEHWIEKLDPRYADDRANGIDGAGVSYRCSNCNKFGVPSFAYCPHCGSKMDGE